MATLDPNRRCRTCAACVSQNEEAGVGLCVLNPPTPFVMGMVQQQPSVLHQGAQVQAQPVIRAYYPLVNLNEGCMQHEPDDMHTIGRA